MVFITTHPVSAFSCIMISCNITIQLIQQALSDVIHTSTANRFALAMMHIIIYACLCCGNC